MTWYNEDGGIVRDKTPLGALNARKTNNANTADPVLHRAVKAAIENGGFKVLHHQNNMATQTNQ